MPAVPLRSRLRLAVLGDSIAYGTGAAAVDDTLGRRLVAALSHDGFAVDLHVFAVPGAVSAGLAGQVQRARLLAPDLAVVVIGANDLARFVPPAEAAAALRGAVGTLRSVGTDVIVVPAPDMSSIPTVPPAFRATVRAACRLLQREQADVAEAAGCTVASVATEVYDAFAEDPGMFSADRFHPSSAGYARIAAALAPYVLDAARARRNASAD
jgi:lysophospholipase L1-like esterase